MMDSYRRWGLARPALLCLSLLATSCGGEKPPPTPDPPQAMLSVPQPNTVGMSLTVQVGATGCESIQSLSIYDGEEFIKSVAYAGGGMVSVDIGAAELKYTRGIAAQLTLKSRVVCTDGRQNDSLQQPATFFPVAEVIELPPGNTGQVVPDFFVAAGSGVGLYFIGCGNLPNGIGRLFKVSKTGEVLASVDMLFPCTVNTVITGVHPTSRKRWVWTPGSGAIAVDEQLNISGKSVGQIDTLTVGPGGDALVFNSATSSLQRISHETGAFKWTRGPYLVRGGLIAAPLVNTSGVVLVPSVGSDASIGTVILTATVDWGDQNAATGGLETGSFIVKQLSFSQMTLPRLPTAAFNADGTVLYVTLEGAAQLTQVFACGARANGCEGAAQRWSQVPVLDAAILALVPYANGGRMAAIGAQKTWFLDTSTGNVVNKGKQPISTQSALVTLQVQPGGGPYPQSFYILNGPVPTAGLPTPIPVEIVGLDSAENGSLYRYQINSGTLAAAVDDSGTLWLRVGRKLVRPLTVTQYRQVRPVTP